MQVLALEALRAYTSIASHVAITTAHGRAWRK